MRRTEEQVSRTLHLWRAPPAPEPPSLPKEEVAVLGQRPAAPMKRGVGNGANPRPPRAAPSNRGRRESRGPGPLLELPPGGACPPPMPLRQERFLPRLRPAGCDWTSVPEMRVEEGPRSPWAECPADSGANASARSGARGAVAPGGYTPDHPLVQAIAQAIDQWARSQATQRQPPGAPTWRQYPR